MASTIPYDEHTSALKDAWSTANFLAYGNAKALLNHNYRGLYRKVYFLDIQKGKLKKISSNIVNDNIFPDNIPEIDISTIYESNSDLFQYNQIITFHCPKINFQFYFD